MKTKKHCELLMKFKNNGVKLSSYMGTRWLTSKMVISVVAFSALFRQDEVSRIVGASLLGYLLGVVIANARSYMVAKTKWEIQKELIDWNKVEEHLKSNE